MNKIAKVMLATSMVFGTALGVSITEGSISQNEATATTTQSSFSYYGYTADGGEFVLSQSFYNGLNSGDVTFNGIKVNSQYVAQPSVKIINDQIFQQVHGDKANSVEFDLQEHAVSLEEMRVQFGANFTYQPPIHGEKVNASDGLYEYQVGEGNIIFHMTNGYVKSVTVS
ncbi:hypothetical protein BU065_05810 [Staphylococcus succinus]|uniref:Immunodominant staphylococcal antigen B n=1 Tax=Staphylococcus succinus TaxID=61015 RepID=A0A9Q6MU61_9STAP|nr:hypothetical protein [Staphylococcus succinus]MEB8125785.1 hypothetical protein [Staphylococcus succinus]MEB8210961.1 hypothetical protein [Staphylococcus succinus]PTI39206.1 hypothetical protein BU062_11720 [Staphylococcus succinus]PTI74116.1 hypothetical protein BU058_11810 [Staphylococcus succinus]PTJ20461.1 hypothetical protein BU069_02210 [Staphylococcus succinus]